MLPSVWRDFKEQPLESVAKAACVQDVAGGLRPGVRWWLRLLNHPAIGNSWVCNARACATKFQTSEEPGIYRGLCGWASLLSTASHLDLGETEVAMGWNQHTSEPVTSQTWGWALDQGHVAHRGLAGQTWFWVRSQGSKTCKTWWSYFQKYTENSFLREPYETMMLERGSLKSLQGQSHSTPLPAQIGVFEAAERELNSSAWALNGFPSSCLLYCTFISFLKSFIVCFIWHVYAKFEKRTYANVMVI